MNDNLIDDLEKARELLKNKVPVVEAWHAIKALEHVLEYMFVAEHNGKSQDEQIKGRRMSDAESVGMLFDDSPDISVDAFIKWCSESHMMGDATLKGIKYWVEKYKEQL